MRCLNCDSLVEKNFCAVCGQKNSIHRFSLKDIFSLGIFNGIYMLNRGFFFTIKELFTRPGHSIREYLNGKRINHFNAFSLLILLITVVYLVDGYSEIKIADLVGEDDNVKGFTQSIESFMKDYPKAIYLINIPLMAIASYFSFKKSKINFAENIILNTYVSGALIILTFPLTVLSVFYSGKDILILMFRATPYFTFAYVFIVYYQFYSSFNFRKVGLIVRSVLAIGIFSALQVAAIVILLFAKS
ncbi:Protein of unknown function [Marivirga sericea]|uniref:DUF3667 domain-containing protein n=1 Tax=Marivirga sericea TaxID=1028 RepID=A0A1X7K5R7_9BACT|nr:DUF3667 domain-containing protein [Marivirga sericea]SMG36111.1 Protein of unknown function [Marivirga sericea]